MSSAKGVSRSLQVELWANTGNLAHPARRQVFIGHVLELLGQHGVKFSACKTQHDEILQKVQRNAARLGEFPALEWIE